MTPKAEAHGVAQGGAFLSGAPLGTPPEESSSEARPSWGFSQGDEITSQRLALQRLGGGHKYETYTAWDEHLYSIVVVKLLRPHLVADEHSLKALAQETAILERLAHPVIVRGFGAVLEGPRPHLVMEHLEGPTLSSLVRKYGALPLEQLIPLSLQLCAALHYLAQEEVVHLDVKPRNVIMGGPPRLIDLSIARSFEEASRIRKPIGTDLYMAPEQCAPIRLGAPGWPADVWALGATLYHAAVGKPPFDRSGDFDPDNPLQRWPQLASEPMPIFKEVPGKVESIIFSCLERDPLRRPTAGEVAVQLEPLVAALPRRRVLGRLRPRIR